MSALVYQGDCLNIISTWEKDSIDLIYLDPPFFSQKTHKLTTRDSRKEFSFQDLWSSHQEYGNFIYQRLQEMWRILSPSGSIFVHCDRHASHLIRLLLDDVFSPQMFRSEIIWHYKRWSNSQKALLPAHQTIFYYTKSDDYTFNFIYGEYSETTNVDQILQRRKRDEYGKSIYDKDLDGNIIPSGGKKGVPLSDVWEIPYLNPKAKERVGYPTQKPLLLLEQIIKIATNEGDLILDPFCGSGTTLVAASLLGRNSVGIDISTDAVELTKKRLSDPIKTNSNLLTKGRDSYKNVDESVLGLLWGLDFAVVHRNKGIDAILRSDVNGCPIPVRVQRNHETIVEAANYLYNASKNKNALVMFLIAINEGGYFSDLVSLPPGVRVINAPGLSILNSLSQLDD
ncbi:MAG: site-specific DNA-methyltransferase [Limnospira sp. PMC 1291.21]|uniref:Methyltransferase n=3 Tax=Limnospira TaxID=2596745 RepID=A0A9P1NZ60_9CYAN|nr:MULTISPECIES: site-specific DNA-methyltransferase [Limnospira]EKD07113.1 DNA methylase N-4/N-6 domain protein [Arthrospira platensis C1]MDC0837336.1 site-specific DNA-methyltransferase [Limnoraphis robusta]MDY7052115.1 site-specific DNA-methyltransferase [Limnospira fusiformis LS22]QJB26096.1 site-specific DNA-methyltransferase [Limnospira fusiformis SAG 85.79]RAQ44048.1 site-specific DNA-methyltransferase [Arthrospira sp. O9.13F]